MYTVELFLLSLLLVLSAALRQEHGGAAIFLFAAGMGTQLLIRTGLDRLRVNLGLK